MPQIAVIGAGIVGLTTALEIQAKGHAVTIYAEAFPGDEKSTRYTSPWAGAHYLNVKGNSAKHREYENATFERLWADSEDVKCLVRTQDRQFYAEDRTGITELDHMPNFRVIPASELIPSATSGVTFTSITIDTAAYLPLLLARFLSGGGRVRRASVQHIDQVLLGSWGMPVPDVLVVCPGLGARTLGGVEDSNIYPIRGQTVLVNAPWVQECRGMSHQNGDVSYIIPRRPSGHVVLGGTFGVGDWYPHPRPETARKIMEHALELMPELVPDKGRKPSVEDVEALVVEHGCGLRPARKGGIRVERDTVRVGGPNGREVPVVYNYGHGGAGYQASWGTAYAATGLVEDALKSA